MLKTSALFLILMSLSMYSSLELVKIDPDMLPSEASRGTLIQMMVEVQTTKNPKTIGGFVKALWKMLHGLQAAQKKHRRIHKKMMRRCRSEETFRSKEVRAARGARRRSGIARSKCKKSKKAAKRELPAMIRTRTSFKGVLRRARTARKLANKSYLSRRRAYRQAIKFLRNFFRYIKRRFKKTYKAWAMMQFSENLLKHTTNLGLISEAVPALVAIAETTAKGKRHNNYKFKAHQNLAKALKAAIKKLLIRLIKDNKKNESTERNAKKAFRKFSKRLTRLIRALTKNIGITSRHIRKMRYCITMENGIIGKAIKKFGRNNGLRRSARKMCKAFNREFVASTKARFDEVKTMMEILRIVKRRLKNIPKGLIAYLKRVKRRWIKYVNSTKFKAYKALRFK